MRTPVGGSDPRSLSPILWAAQALATCNAPAHSAEGPAASAVPKVVRAVLDAHCADCHAERGEGNVGVTALDGLKLGNRLDTLNNIQDQFFYRMMPPPKEDPPTANEARVLAACVCTELREHDASKTLGNWYTTLLNAHGNPIKHSSDPDPSLARFGIDQTGAIKQFLA